uniref:Ribosome biogenesis protein NOP53 n=1 Tax=Lotharella globosa TaxID=91324 RepID=A0A7S3Z1F2_9EUKA|mmetsp:Transcript_5888/g.10675  ORF Transcript_5888/g.10675 Transcript_5888/m.10675 type:complete len:237 (+) Transcript_5888:75-785(+)
MPPRCAGWCIATLLLWTATGVEDEEDDQPCVVPRGKKIRREGFEKMPFNILGVDVNLPTPQEVFPFAAPTPVKPRTSPKKPKGRIAKQIAREERRRKLQIERAKAFVAEGRQPRKRLKKRPDYEHNDTAELMVYKEVVDEIYAEFKAREPQAFRRMEAYVKAYPPQNRDPSRIPHQLRDMGATNPKELKALKALTQKTDKNEAQHRRAMNNNRQGGGRGKKPQRPPKVKLKRKPKY